MKAAFNTKLILSLVLLGFTSLSAQLSPGPLHQSHAHLEGLANCTQCHSAKKQIDPAKCLACHQVLKERIESGRGLHADIEHQSCQRCHIEHHGRDFTLIRWPDNNIDNFDHSHTGYALKGRHAALDCRACHRTEFIISTDKLTAAGKKLNRTYLGLSKSCGSCHKDEHRGQLGSNCQDCHTEEAWQPAARFSHDKSAFPLRGRHIKAACDSCHRTAADAGGTYRLYKPVKHAQCSACHSDVHAGRLGTDCQGCHNPGSWTQIAKGRFTHDMTAFPLKGRHQVLSCRACHKQGRSTPIVNFQRCSDCHDDAHQGQFTGTAHEGRCDHCHNEAGFAPSTYTIGQHQNSRYPLTGSHLAVPCTQCHLEKPGTPWRFRFSSFECQVCHEDAHNGQSLFKEGIGCDFCHSTESWQQIAFTHNESHTARLGRHQLASCRECHVRKSDNKWLMKDQEDRCQQCHAENHDGQFAISNQTDCARCHTPVDWMAEKFDHNRDSDFPLSGRHATLACEACHKPYVKAGRSIIRYRPLGKNCTDCHHDRRR